MSEFSSYFFGILEDEQRLLDEISSLDRSIQNEKKKTREHFSLLTYLKSILPLDPFHNCGHQDKRFTVISYGRPQSKPEEVEMGIQLEAPLFYESKGIYKPHIGCKRQKTHYYCKINKDVLYEILCDCGKRWSGKTCWEDFSKDFEDFTLFTDLKDFFGISYTNVEKVLEKLKRGKN